jgi:hypothetical protein
MKWLDKQIVNAVIRRRDDLLIATGGMYGEVKRVREISKPHIDFNIYNTTYEVWITWKYDQGDLTTAVILDLQHKHSIPETAAVEIYEGESYSSRRTGKRVKFSWPDPNNIEEKE